MKAYWRRILRHCIIWTIVIGFWSLVRNFGQEVVRPYGDPTLIQYIRIHIALGIVAGMLFGSMEFFIDKYVYKRVPLGRVLLIGVVSYLIVFLILATFGIRAFSYALNVQLDWDTYNEFLFSKQMFLLFVYLLLAGGLVDTFTQVDRKLGPGNLWKMVKGEFYQPKEDERIFMFLDLKSSTTIAEKLGHIRYSQLIQDCFRDLDVTGKYQAEIYQYVGDEAVLTWPKDVGMSNANCLRAYFEFKDRLAHRSGYYTEKYGLVPEFKAGLNVGKIIIAEVGDVKTEIAYHGDTINTASRIQDQCNPLGRSVLISEELRNGLQIDTTFTTELVGEVVLKGKSQRVNIYSIESTT